MALDRQSIEKRDFPIGRRGYEPEAVDAHLARIAEEVEELRRRSGGAAASGGASSSPASLAQAASEQVRSIVEAAESSAAAIERGAQDEALRIREEAESDARQTRDEAVAQSQEQVGNVRSVTTQMLQRVDAMESELAGLVESLRTGANRLTADMSLLEGGMGDLYDAAGRGEIPAPSAAAPPRRRRRAPPRPCRRPAAAETAAEAEDEGADEPEVAEELFVEETVVVEAVAPAEAEAARRPRATRRARAWSRSTWRSTGPPARRPTATSPRTSTWPTAAGCSTRFTRPSSPRGPAGRVANPPRNSTASGVRGLMLRLCLCLLVAGALLFAPALAPAADAAVPKGFFGVMVNGPLDDPAVDLDAQAVRMKASGVQSWRVEMAWDLIEPAPGQFAWAATDRKVLAAARQGIDVLGLALRAPAWANGGGGNPFTPPTRPGRLRGLPARAGRALRAERLALGRAPGCSAPRRARVGDLERAQPEGLLHRAAVRQAVRGAAARGLPGGPRRRPGRDRPDGVDGQLLVARPRQAAVGRRPAAALRRRRRASVLRAAVQRRQDRARSTARCSTGAATPRCRSGSPS